MVDCPQEGRTDRRQKRCVPISMRRGSKTQTRNRGCGLTVSRGPRRFQPVLGEECGHFFVSPELFHFIAGGDGSDPCCDPACPSTLSVSICGSFIFSNQTTCRAPATVLSRIYFIQMDHKSANSVHEKSSVFVLF